VHLHILSAISVWISASVTVSTNLFIDSYNNMSKNVEYSNHISDLIIQMEDKTNLIDKLLREISYYTRALEDTQNFMNSLQSGINNNLALLDNININNVRDKCFICLEYSYNRICRQCKCYAHSHCWNQYIDNINSPSGDSQTNIVIFPPCPVCREDIYI
jgi:hypothetical protein